MQNGAKTANSCTSSAGSRNFFKYFFVKKFRKFLHNFLNQICSLLIFENLLTIEIYRKEVKQVGIQGLSFLDCQALLCILDEFKRNRKRIRSVSLIDKHD